MKRVIVTALVAVTLLLTSTATGSAQTFVRMLAGPAGGSWYPLGAKIMEVIDREIPQVATSNGPGGGIGNVRDVDAGNAEIGWTFGFTAHQGYRGEGPFKRAHTNVRHFASLYTGLLHTAVPRRSDIRSYGDLKGRNISPGQTFTAGYQMFVEILREYGVTIDDLKRAGGTVHHVSFSDSVALMKDGHVQAYTAAVEPPHSTFIDLNFSMGIRFLPVDEPVAQTLLQKNPGYVRAVIPRDAYERLEADVPTIGAPVTLVVHKDLPDDLVYRMARAMWDHHAEIAAVRDIWKEVRLEHALQGAGAPLHPGARRFYDERGVGK
jgi:uncharacterized protein